MADQQPPLVTTPMFSTLLFRYQPLSTPQGRPLQLLDAVAGLSRMTKSSTWLDISRRCMPRLCLNRSKKFLHRDLWLCLEDPKAQAITHLGGATSKWEASLMRLTRAQCPLITVRSSLPWSRIVLQLLVRRIVKKSCFFNIDVSHAEMGSHQKNQ